MTGLFRFLLFLLLALLGLFVKNWLRPERSIPRPSPGGADRPRVTGRMLKDPQCGTYVAAELAVSARAGGQTLHFCSRECRDLYLAALQ